MRGEEKQKHRAAKLRYLKDKYSYEIIASKAGLSAPYLSQIGNEVIQSRGKNPRTLSDAYAEKIEKAFDLETGWFDREENTNNLHTGSINEPPTQYNTKSLPTDHIVWAFNVMTYAYNKLEIDVSDVTDEEKADLLSDLYKLSARDSQVMKLTYDMALELAKFKTDR